MQPPIAPSPSSGIPNVTVISAKPQPFFKRFLLIIILVVLVVGTATTVALVQVQQRLNIAACDCNLYNFFVGPDGIVTTTNDQTISEPAQKVSVYINSQPAGVFDVPALSAGQSAEVGTVNIPSQEFTWNAVGDKACSDSGSHIPPTPTPSPSPEISATPIPTPTSEVTTTPEETPSVTPSAAPSETPVPTDTPVVTPTPTVIPSPTPTGNPPDNPPAPPNSCNGSCSSTANCTAAEDGVQLICIQNHCRYPSCTDQESCHCPPGWPASTPKPTPTKQLAQTGSISPTIITSIFGTLLLGAGLILAL